MRRLLVSAALVLLGVVGAGCGDDDGDDRAADATPADEDPAAPGAQEQEQEQEPGPGDLDAFCAEMARASEERPEEYVGSPEHLDDIDALRAAAPSEVRSEVDVLRDFLAEGGVDPDDPDSTLTRSWPPPVQAAISEILSFADQRCP